MAVLQGYGGKLMVGTAQVAEIGEWSLDIGAGTEDTSAFGDAWKKFTPTQGEWSGSASGRFDPADTNGQIALQNAVLNRASVSLRFYVDATHYYSGTAYVTRCSPAANVGGVVEIAFEFQGTGPLTYT